MLDLVDTTSLLVIISCYRSNVSKMKAESRGKGKQRQKAHRPNSEQADQDNAPVTPCTSDRAPGHAGRTKRQGQLLKMYVKKNSPHRNVSRLVSALNATVAVQRFRSRRSQSEEAREEPSVLVSQVLNPEHLNQSGNNRKLYSNVSFIPKQQKSSFGNDPKNIVYDR